MYCILLLSCNAIFVYQHDDDNACFVGDRPLDEKTIVELSQKINFLDPAIPTDNIKVQNELHVCIIHCVWSVCY